MNRNSILIILTIVFCAIFFSSCNKMAPQEFVITFDSNGGSSVATQTVIEGGKITEPSPAPTKESNNFVGWFTYDNVFIKWDFAIQTVATDTTLYARWIPITSEEDCKKITVPLIERDDFSNFEKTVIFALNILKKSLRRICLEQKKSAIPVGL